MKMHPKSASYKLPAHEGTMDLRSKSSVLHLYTKGVSQTSDLLAKISKVEIPQIVDKHKHERGFFYYE